LEFILEKASASLSFEEERLDFILGSRGRTEDDATDVEAGVVSVGEDSLSD
jgi:hypothetical protein